MVEADASLTFGQLMLQAMQDPRGGNQQQVSQLLQLKMLQELQKLGGGQDGGGDNLGGARRPSTGST